MKVILARTAQLFTAAFGDCLLGFSGIAVFGFLTCFMWSYRDRNSRSVLWTSIGAGGWSLALCLPPAMGADRLIAAKTASAFGLPSAILLVFVTLIYIMALSASAGMAGARFGRLSAGGLKK
ncbi:MAG: hypothetical protein Q7R35_11280 [Elusimicrobiota bacterium]|nr:hypothetical protein [Elusimicrobiota bacterium]